MGRFAGKPNCAHLILTSFMAEQSRPILIRSTALAERLTNHRANMAQILRLLRFPEVFIRLIHDHDPRIMPIWHFLAENLRFPELT